MSAIGTMATNGTSALNKINKIRCIGDIKNINFRIFGHNYVKTLLMK